MGAAASQGPEVIRHILWVSAMGGEHFHIPLVSHRPQLKGGAEPCLLMVSVSKTLGNSF